VPKSVKEPEHVGWWVGGQGVG